MRRTPTPRPATPTPQTVTVPNLAKMKSADAQAALRNAGLAVTVQQGNVNAEAGTVAAQSPEPGVAVPPGARVTLVVATGQVAVPDVAGKSREDALNLLINDAGFRVPATPGRRSNQFPAGVAIGTAPEAGRLLNRGSDVELLLSLGP